MRGKWYISALIIALAFLGVSQEQLTVPNQEIVLQFANQTVTSEEAQDAITIVKNQLQAIGIDNIQVQDAQNGRLKIAYYSATDVSSIKEILSIRKNLELDYASSNHEENKTKLPLDKNTNHYNLDIYEIQNGDDSGFGLGGKYIFELKQEYVRFYNPNVFLFATIVAVNTKDSYFKVAYIINRNIAIAIDNTSYKIPEVRAGPSC